MSTRSHERSFTALAFAIAVMAAAPASRADRELLSRSATPPDARPSPVVVEMAQPMDPLPPPRKGKYCLEQPDAKVLLTHTFGLQVNPLGVENQLTLSVCVPITRTPGVLFDLANLELGVVNYLSPVYDYAGGFISLSPLSIMKLRVEVAGIGLWSIPLKGAGYYGFKSYDDDFSEDTRPKGEGGSATGSVVAFSGVLQGKVPLPRGAALLVSDTVLAELWTVGDEPYFYNSRRDVLIARSDWTIKNTALLLAEIPITDNISVRAGLADDMIVIPRSGYSSNVLAGISTVLVKRIGRTIRNFQPFARVGGFLQHASSSEFRKGEINMLAGVSAVYDLATIESDGGADQKGLAARAGSSAR